MKKKLLIKSLSVLMSMSILIGMDTLTVITYAEEIEEPTVDEIIINEESCPVNELAINEESGSLDELSSKTQEVGIATFESGDFEYSFDNGVVTLISLKNKSATKVEVPEKVSYEGNDYYINTIYKDAFNGCTNLKEVTLSEKVDSIGNSCFWGCTSLEKITINGNLRDNSNRSNCYFDDAGKNAPSFEVIFGPKVTRVPCQLFYDWSGRAEKIYLTKITFLGDIEEIAFDAFFGCDKLTNVTFPKSLKTIAQGAFGGCSKLSEVELFENVELIGKDAFLDCYGLKKLSINSNVTIESGAFAGCSGLTEVYLNSKQMDIGREVFARDTSLQKMVINTQVKEPSAYDGERFIDCGKNSSSFEIEFGSNVSMIHHHFITTLRHKKEDGDYNHVTSLRIPVTIEKITFPAFNQCFDLKKIYFEGTKERWNQLMADCSDKENELPVGVQMEFGDKPYVKGDTTYTITYEGLTDVTIAEGTILPDSFVPNKRMKTITLPGAKKLTKEGYTFSGWYNKETNRRVKAITRKMKKDLVLEARWKENKYHVVFRMSRPAGVKKGRFSCRPVRLRNVLYTGSISLPADITFTAKDGTVYTLAGWTTTTKSKPGEDFDVGKDYTKFGGKTKTGKTINLYPIWKELS